MLPKPGWTLDLANLSPFVGILIKESQRLHNPSYEPGRTPLADVIIPGGYQIQKEAVMIVAIHHNSPAVWDKRGLFSGSLEHGQGQEQTQDGMFHSL